MIASTSDIRPEREYTFRFYDPSRDEEAVRAVFARQNLDVRLPLPGKDPACALGIVAEKNGEIKFAFFLRSTYELHLVVDPNEELQPYVIRRLGAIAEGAAMQLGVEMAKLKFPVPVDAIAFVPSAMQRMIDYMRKLLGFHDEATEGESPKAHLLVKKLGS